MTPELTSAEMLAAGWKRSRSAAGNPRLIDPFGQVWVRTILGTPGMIMIGETGVRHCLTRVYRSGDSLLRILRTEPTSAKRMRRDRG